MEKREISAAGRVEEGWMEAAKGVAERAMAVRAAVVREAEERAAAAMAVVVMAAAGSVEAGLVEAAKGVVERAVVPMDLAPSQPPCGCASTTRLSMGTEASVCLLRS